MDKLRKMIRQSEEDLESTQPPIRARGMVSLGRLARGYLGILPKETAPLVVELEQADSPNEDDPIYFLIQGVLRLAMIALSDSESYVYLAVRSAEKYSERHQKNDLYLLLTSIRSSYRLCRLLLPLATCAQETFCQSLPPQSHLVL
jgi:hypothetical protein